MTCSRLLNREFILTLTAVPTPDWRKPWTIPLKVLQPGSRQGGISRLRPESSWGPAWVRSSKKSKSIWRWISGAIPHFQPTSAIGHPGRLLCGRIRSLPVAVLQGRLHPYEGHSPAAITLPVRVLRALGARLLILTNASGGLNPRYRAGDVLVIEDHINLLGGNPLLGLCGSNHAGSNISRQTYDPVFIERALESARQANFAAHRGVYVGVTGPNYETRAEYRFLRRIGGDAVGMSTIPEALFAASARMRVLALSAITNLGLPDAPQRTRATTFAPPRPTASASCGS